MKSQSIISANITPVAYVLSETKVIGINISQACVPLLRRVGNQEPSRRWKVDNTEFIAAYNEGVARDGLPLDEWKNF